MRITRRESSGLIIAEVVEAKTAEHEANGVADQILRLLAQNCRSEGRFSSVVVVHLDDSIVTDGIEDVVRVG